MNLGVAQWRTSPEQRDEWIVIVRGANDNPLN
jgi:hypothetical protein